MYVISFAYKARKKFVTSIPDSVIWSRKAGDGPCNLSLYISLVESCMALTIRMRERGAMSHACGGFGCFPLRNGTSAANWSFFLLNNFHPQHVVVSDGWAGLDTPRLRSGGSLANPWHTSGAGLLADKEHNWMALLELQLMCHFWLTLSLFAACLEAPGLSHTVQSTERGNSLPYLICLSVSE